MRVTIFDYGVGNLHSLTKALESWGAEVRIESDPAVVLDSDALVLPGVGAFGAAAEQLQASASHLTAALHDSFPCLGICLGMQLFFDTSEESAGRGLGIVPGTVRRLDAARVPHMGWNTVDAVAGESGPDPLFAGIAGMAGYFANSYFCDAEDPADVIAWTEYGGKRFPSAIRRGQIWGVQFHPEKSGSAGRALLHNFLEQVRR